MQAIRRENYTLQNLFTIPVVMEQSRTPITLQTVIKKNGRKVFRKWVVLSLSCFTIRLLAKLG